MISDLRELYQEVIIDHSKKPRNFLKLSKVTHKAEGFNPLCGDEIAIYLEMEGDVVKDVSFQGSGCAISTASASMMTESLKGKKRTEIEDMFHHFHEMVTSSSDPCIECLGKLCVFRGVCEFPGRVKCASLCWHTLMNAVKNNNKTALTE